MSIFVVNQQQQRIFNSTIKVCEWLEAARKMDPNSPLRSGCTNLS